MDLKEQFRKRMQRPGGELLLTPLVTDPFSALLAQRAGFDTVYLGGGSLGYVLGVSEALLTANEMADALRRITDRTDLAVIVDGGVGFGDAVHVKRTIEIIENAGAVGIEIEDQIAPKRAHHHKDVEHLVSTEEMVGKIKAAIDARRSDNFVIIARCNAPQIEGIDRSLERAQAYTDAGAHVAMLRARNDEEWEQISKRTTAPLATLASWTMKPAAEMQSGGYRLIMDPNSITVLTYHALSQGYANMKAGKGYGPSRDDINQAMLDVRELVGLEELYEIEAQTTEKETLAAMAAGVTNRLY